MTLAIDSTDKDNYFAARQAMIEAKQFIDLPRCVSCVEYLDGQCKAHDVPVSEQHLYQINECPSFDNVPF